MIPQPILAWIIGAWEIILILLVLGTPVAIAGIVLLVVFLAKSDRPKATTPPPVSNDRRS